MWLELTGNRHVGVGVRYGSGIRAVYNDSSRVAEEGLYREAQFCEQVMKCDLMINDRNIHYLACID
jgi:hypothetical protein